jgi:prepilin-type processing-associated H-X9-DG protein
MRGAVMIGLGVAALLLLLGLFLSVIPRWRESANRLRCQDNLRQVGWFALWDYTDKPSVFGGKDHRPLQLGGIQPNPAALFPPGTLPNAGLPPERRLSLHFILLPHFGRDELAGRFDQKLAWDAEPNLPAARTVVPTLVCPSYYKPGGPEEPAQTQYVGSTGVGADAARLPVEDPHSGLFRYDGQTPVGAVRDGLSYTMVLTETTWENGPWAAGGPPTLRGVDPARRPYLGPGRPFGGTHPGGVNVIFSDGSVRFVTNSVNPEVYEAYATISRESQAGR